MIVTIGRKKYSNLALRKSGFDVKPTIIWKVKVNGRTVEVFLDKAKAKKLQKELRQKAKKRKR